MHLELRLRASVTLLTLATLLPLLTAMTLILTVPVEAIATTGSLAIPGGGHVNLGADNFSRDFEKGVVEVSGNVKVFFNGQYLSCDRAIINEKTQKIEAFGSLVLSSSQAYVEGDAAILDYKTNTGIIQNGFVKNGQVILEGRVVRKTGPETYEAENAYYTACTTCPTAWTFAGTRMSARMGGYAFIKNPLLKIANIPVLWLPYLVVPLKSERQSGLLSPDLDIFADEVALGLPFFWAISRSQDATITPKLYSRRGLKILSNYRYMLSEESYGEGNAGIINDRVFGTEESLNALPGGSRSRRWFFNYAHTYELPGDLSQKTKLNLVSDLIYPTDFWKEVPGKGDPALENRLSLTRNTELTHASIDVAYYINMMTANPFSNNNEAVHRWPELRFSVADRPVFKSNLLFRMDINYVNFTREGYAFDHVIPAGIDPATGQPYDRQIDANHSGYAQPRTGGPHSIDVGGGSQFNPVTDIVRTGQRLDLKPEIAYPFNVGRFLDVLPSIQLRHTQYAFNVAPSADNPNQYDSMPFRNYARGKISARTTFYRIYGNEEGLSRKPEIKPPSSNWIDEESRALDEDLKVPKGVHADIFRHEFQPEIVGSYIPYIRQPDSHPFFSRNAQLPIFLEEQPISNENFTNVDTTLQFDYHDRISSRTLVTLQATNRLVRKRWLSGTPVYRQIAAWKIGQSYDFDEAKRQDPPRLPYSDIFSNFDLHLDRIDIYSVLRYYPYHRVTTSTSTLRLKNASDTEFAQVTYNQTYNISRNVAQTTEAPQTVGLSGGFKSKYLDLAATLDYAAEAQNLKLTTWRGDFNIKPPGNCWGIKLQYVQPVGGKREIYVNFDFNFGGLSG